MLDTEHLIVRHFVKNDFLYHIIVQIIDETLSPVWDELLLFEEILVYGRREDIKANPPTVIIEIYDQDKVITFGYFQIKNQNNLYNCLS